MRQAKPEFRGKRDADTSSYNDDAELAKAREQTKKVESNPYHVILRELTRCDISNYDRT